MERSRAARRIPGIGRGGAALLAAGVLLAAPAAAETPASRRPDPCGLFTQAGAEKIAGTAMTREVLPAMNARFQCTYQQTDTQPVLQVRLTFTLSGGRTKEADEGAWKLLADGATARGQTKDTRGLEGLGDEAFMTHLRGPMSFQTVLYVRKGPWHFIIDGQRWTTEPIAAMKDVGKRIAGQL
jgi:hypothetical protein